MTRVKSWLVTTAAALGLGFAATATAGGLDPDLAPKKTVDLCVAEIAGHADYSNAVRVRHEVESKQRRTIGFVLKIDTLVYDSVGGDAIREYATICKVGHGEKPLKFRIREAGTRS